MRKLILLVALLCNEAVAQQPPSILGTIRNRADGAITLTTETCRTDKTMFFVFVRDDGGKLSLTGCWRTIDYNVFIKWSDGDVYTYPIDNVEFSQEYDEWYAERQRQKNRTAPML